MMSDDLNEQLGNAAQEGDLEKVIRLLDDGAEIERVDKVLVHIFNLLVYLYVFIHVNMHVLCRLGIFQFSHLVLLRSFYFLLYCISINSYCIYVNVFI